MSSLQVDSISSMGGGHVDGAGKVVQFKDANTTTETTISQTSQATICTLNFTPKLSNSLILCQGFHSNDAAVSSTSYCNAYILAGVTEVCRGEAVGYNDTKLADARYQFSYSGLIPSWGTTSLVIKLDVFAAGGSWTVSRAKLRTSLYVWELAQ